MSIEIALACGLLAAALLFSAWRERVSNARDARLLAALGAGIGMTAVVASL